MLMCSGVECGQKRFGAGAAAREGTGGPCRRPRCACVVFVQSVAPHDHSALIRTVSPFGQAQIAELKKDTQLQQDQLKQVCAQNISYLSCCVQHIRERLGCVWRVFLTLTVKPFPTICCAGVDETGDRVGETANPRQGTGSRSCRA